MKKDKTFWQELKLATKKGFSKKAIIKIATKMGKLLELNTLEKVDVVLAVDEIIKGAINYEYFRKIK